KQALYEYGRLWNMYICAFAICSGNLLAMDVYCVVEAIFLNGCSLSRFIMFPFTIILMSVRFWHLCCWTVDCANFDCFLVILQRKGCLLVVEAISVDY
ncbi:hypothetical protein VIGAN_01419200, partial [Vigna angularis var. angularis]